MKASFRKTNVVIAAESEPRGLRYRNGFSFAEARREDPFRDDLNGLLFEFRSGRQNRGSIYMSIFTDLGVQLHVVPGSGSG